jgi:hypothetical protein
MLAELSSLEAHLKQFGTLVTYGIVMLGLSSLTLRQRQ